MTAGTLAVVLSLGLVASTVGSPWLLRHAAPALVRFPRLAIAVIGGGIIVWLGTVLSLGPMLAWMGSGPALLPEGAAVICQRCLAAANPFSIGTADTPIPALVLLLLPALLALGLGIGIIRQMMRRTRRSHEDARVLLRDSAQRRLYGHSVSVVEADHPFALTFPRSHGGIVISTGALHSLDADELRAVLAHEHAHLRQRHHLLSALMASVTVFLHWAPLIAAAADALPHYLEIAADDQARHRAGTPALVSALVKLGERVHPAMPHPSCAGALHAAGPERIRQLTHPSSGLSGTLPAITITAYLVALSVASAAVILPYASVTLAGCT